MDCNSLQKINIQYQQILDNKKYEECEKSSEVKKQRRRLICLSITEVFLVTAALGMLWGVYHTPALFGEPYSAERKSVSEKYKRVLSQPEQLEWNSTKSDKEYAYLQFNSSVEVKNGTQADIHLVNPPYCVYDYKIYIRDVNGSQLYESDMITPGTIVENIILEHPLEGSSENVVVSCQFYKSGTTKKVGSSEMEAVLVS